MINNRSNREYPLIGFFHPYDIDTKQYTYKDLFNPKPFLKFSIKSFEDIENGTEVLTNI